MFSWLICNFIVSIVVVVAYHLWIHVRGRAFNTENLAQEMRRLISTHPDQPVQQPPPASAPPVAGPVASTPVPAPIAAPAKAPVVAPVAPVPAPAPLPSTSSDTIDEHIAAVIAAAVAVVLDGPMRILGVQLITAPMPPHMNVWAHEGRMQIFSSHRIR